MPFLAICRSQPSLFEISCVILISKSKNLAANEKIKQKNDRIKIILKQKDFIKQPVITQGPTFLSFSFLIDCCISVFFSFLIKAFAEFERLRLYRQAFIVYKNGENLKILIKIFCQNL